MTVKIFCCQPTAEGQQVKAIFILWFFLLGQKYFCPASALIVGREKAINK